MSDWIAAFTRIKPIVDKPKQKDLKACLGLFDLLCYGVGCSVGAGVYSLIGVGAGMTGPSIGLSFFICGLACIFTSLTYSEFAARVPITGSAYTFVYVSFGELAAWLVGWNLTLGYGISAAGIARSWASYVTVFLQHFGIHVPPVLVEFEWMGQSCSILAAALVLTCSVILLIGVRESAKFNAAVTILNLLVLFFVVVAGSFEVDPNNWVPFLPAGINGVFEAAGVVFFSYLGFDMVACLAEEVENPQELLPKGIVGSLLISMSVYIAVAIVVTGMAPVSFLGPSIPLINAFSYHGMVWAGRVVSFGSMFGLTTAAFTCLMGQPRIFYRMAIDGLLPEFCAIVDKNTQVPSFSTVLTGLMVAAFSFFFDLELLANVISCGTLQVFTFVNAGVLMLRLRSENPKVIPILVPMFVLSTLAASFYVKYAFSYLLTFCSLACCLSCFIWILRLPTTTISTFQCPYVPLIPCLGIISNIYMLVNLPASAWIGVTLWLSIGLIIYLTYGLHHSALITPKETQPLLH